MQNTIITFGKKRKTVTDRPAGVGEKTDPGHLNLTNSNFLTAGKALLEYKAMGYAPEVKEGNFEPVEG
jgi:hypothetical protein